MKRIVPVLFLLVLFAAPAAAEDEPAVRNETCPVMLGEPVDPELFVDYEGKRVWFCCEGCIEDFQADPKRYLAALPQFSADTDGDGIAEEEGENHAIGALHPALVHFPIALTVAAALAAALSFLLARGFFTTAWTYVLLLAAVMSIPAFLLGEEAEELKGRMSAGLSEAVHEHEEWGEISFYVLLGVAAFHLVTRVKPELTPLRLLSLLLVLAAAGLMGYTGYLGGEVVRPGHLDALLDSLF